MKLIVLNFVLGKVFVHSVEKTDLEGAELLASLGYRESDCQYMLTEEVDFIEFVN